VEKEQKMFHIITLPGKFTPFGREHPINKVLYEITNIFVSMGFEVEEGPDSGRVFSRLRNRALKWISDVFSVPEKDAEYARIRDGCA
jgi:phenylalanyl-tRNA synthetase alpha subunit